MAINSIEGANPYANNQNVDTAGIDKNTLSNQNTTAPGTEMDETGIASAREAFKVDITEEARGVQQAANEETAPLQVRTGTGELSDETNQPSPEQNTSRIVNIVA